MLMWGDWNTTGLRFVQGSRCDSWFRSQRGAAVRADPRAQGSLSGKRRGGGRHMDAHGRNISTIGC